MLLTDRVAIITGGARGIGKGIALKFAEEGCYTVITDVLETEGRQALVEVSKSGPGAALYFASDLSSYVTGDRLIVAGGAPLIARIKL